ALGPAPAPGGDPADDLGVADLVLAQCRVQLGGDVAGGDRVDGHAAAGPLVGQGFGQLCDRSLGGRVGGGGVPAEEGEHRGDVHDPPVAALEHRAPQQLGQVRQGIHVQLHHLGELLQREVLEPVAQVDAGIVDENVDLVLGQHLLGDLGSSAGIGEVHADAAVTG